MLTVDHLKGVKILFPQFEVIRGALINQIDAVLTPDDSMAGTLPNMQLYNELTAVRLGKSSVSEIVLGIHDLIHIAEGLNRQAKSLERSKSVCRRDVLNMIAGRQAEQKRQLSDRLIELCLDSGDKVQNL